MTEYIEKEAAITIPVLPKEHREYQTFNLDDAYENGWYDALECVEKIPLADVRPVVRGQWIVRGGKFRCSRCDAKALWKREGGTNGFSHEYTQKKSEFCPNCGADLRR